MKILFISEYYPPKIMGGGEINLELLATSLVKAGSKVSVLTSSFQGISNYERKEGVQIFRRLKTGGSPTGILDNLKRSTIFPSSIIKEVKNILKEKEFDVIHFIGTSIIAAKKLSRSNIPLFATIESYPTLCPKGDRLYKGKKECKFVCSFGKFVPCQFNSSEIGKTKNRFYLRYNPLFWFYLYFFHKRLRNSLKYCKLIAISNYIKSLLELHNKKSVVIGNAVDIEKFKIKINFEEKDKSVTKLKIIYLGSLTMYKGPQILLQAIKGIDCRCELYGSGPLEESLKKYIVDNQLDAEVKKPVLYEKIPEIYFSADIIVFPSIWPEPFGRIAIEAMAAGKVVIGSDIGGIRETVKLGDGILFKPGNVEELRDLILKNSINNPVPKKEQNKEELINKNYSIHFIINKLINNYKTNLGQ